MGRADEELEWQKGSRVETSNLELQCLDGSFTSLKQITLENEKEMY